MNTVCEVCGDIGVKRLLLCCRGCKCSATHQYCLDKVVFDASLIEWFCYECLKRRGEVTCIRSLEKVPSERPPSHTDFGSIVHQPITKRVESERDVGPWRSSKSKSFVTKYVSLNKIYYSGNKCTKNKSNWRPMGNYTNGEGRIAKFAAHTSVKDSCSCEIIGTESAKSNNDKNQQVDHEMEVSSVEDKKIVVGADQNKYRAAGSRRNSMDKSEVHGDSNSNIIDGLMPQRGKEEVRLEQLSTQQNDAVDKVMPYSPNDGCEEMFSCPGVKNIPSVRERSADSIDTSNISQHNTTEASESSQRFTKYQKGSSCRRRKTLKMAAASSSSQESEEDITSENISLESNELQFSHDYVLSYRTYLSKAQKKRVMTLIRKIQPEFTVYVATMRKTSIQPPGPYLGITKEYALPHFPDKSTTVTLEMPGNSKKWHPKFYKRDESRKNFLMGQWLDFVCDNHVQEGDILLLVPTKGGNKSTFMVYLLHETTTHSRGGAGLQCVGSCPGGSSTKMASEVHIEEEPITGEHVSKESDMHEYLESEDSGSPFQPEYFVPCKSPLTKSQKRIVEQRVRAIRSEVPLCVAVMKNNNVGIAQRWMLELGSRYASVYLPTKGQTLVLQCGRKTWEAKMMFHNGRRWFINGGWPNFARGNGLRVGDICLFELKKKEKQLTMAVHIIRKEQF